MSIEDFFWLVGLWEGEGWFGFHGNGQGVKYARMGLSTTDEDIANRAANLMGVKVYGPYGPYSEDNNKPYFSVHPGREEEVLFWLAEFFPHMGKRRQQQIQVIFDEFELTEEETPNDGPRSEEG